MKLFSYDNAILSLIRRMIDYFLVSLLWVIASIPIITGGAALTAAMQTIQTSIRKDEGHIFQTFWKRFGAEFKQSTILWLLTLALSGILFLNFCIIRDNEMALFFEILGYGACFVIFLWMQLWFGYLSFFDDDTKTLLHNTFRIALCAPIRTLLAGVLPVVFAVIAYVSYFSFSPVLFVMPVCYLTLHSILMRKIFSRFLADEDAKTLTETF